MGSAERRPHHQPQPLAVQGVLSVACAAAGEELKGHAEVRAVAEGSGRPAAEVLLKWSTQRGTPAVVDAATSAAVDAAAFFSWRMSEEREKVGPPERRPRLPHRTLVASWHLHASRATR